MINTSDMIKYFLLSGAERIPARRGFVPARLLPPTDICSIALVC